MLQQQKGSEKGEKERLCCVAFALICTLFQRFARRSIQIIGSWLLLKLSRMPEVIFFLNIDYRWKKVTYLWFPFQESPCICALVSGIVYT